MEYFLLLLGTVLVNNVLLVKFLGLCSFMGVSNKLDSAIGMGLATTFVLTLASAAGWMLEHWLLQPLGLGFLRILAFILVIAAVVQFTEMVIKKISPALYQVLGIFLPLITTNFLPDCANAWHLLKYLRRLTVCRLRLWWLACYRWRLWALRV